jgi:hypothetical protein
VKINGHGYRQAVERDDVARPTGKKDVFLAYNSRTNAYLGVVIHVSAYGARDRAAELYNTPREVIVVRKRDR